MTENRIRQLERENQLLQLHLRDTCNRFEEKIYELSIVGEIGLSLLNITDFTQVCKTILDVITNNTIVQNCSIMLVDHDKDQLFLVAATNPANKSYVVDIGKIFSKEGIRYSLKVGEGAGGQAVLTRQPVLVEDTGKSPFFASSINTQVKIGSLLSIPLVVEDEVIGVLNLSHRDTNVFTAKDLNFFSILKNFIALSIDTTINHEKLKYSEQKYRVLTENSNDGIAIIQDGKHVYTNPAYQKITGYNHDELAKIPFTLLLDSSHPEAELDEVHALLKGERVKQQLKLKVVGSNQIKVELEINSSPITHNGKSAVLISARDLTVRRQLELQLLHAQKMEAIGTLGGGIAHDFKNILHSIMGLTELLLFTKSPSDRDYTKLSKILQSVERANHLTHQLLAFSRKIESELEQVDLNQAVERMVELLKNILPKMIDIQLRLGFDPRLIHADAAQLEQIIMNLCINARDAMPEGGKLLLATENVILDEAYCKHHLGAVPGQYSCLTVADTGCGMDAQTLLRIFEPFYTTKEVGKGTGLGLAMVYGIVKNHNGYITCDSLPGAGTTFHVYFPAVHRDPDTRVVESDAQEETPSGNETLLLVDDEELILEVFSEVFTQFGYNVMTAENGEKALAILRERNAECALVILDLNMPGMGGEKCFVKIREIWPSAKIIISSGYPVKGDMRRIMEEEADGFISKPYLVKNVLKKVREVLDARV